MHSRTAILLLACGLLAALCTVARADLTTECLAPGAGAEPAACTLAAQRLSHDIDALRNLGHELEIRGRHEGALAVYLAGTDVHPGNRDLLKRSIRARANVRAWRLLDGAGPALPKPLAENADDPDRAACHAARFAAALDPCRRAVLAQPQDGALHARLGDVMRSLGYVDDAIHHYTISEQVGHNNAARKRSALQRLVRDIGRKPPPLARAQPEPASIMQTTVPAAPLRNSTAMADSTVRPQRPRLPPELAGGTRRALVIGNQRYENLPRLNTPRADVEALADTLSRDYGFADIVRLVNANRYEILSALSALRQRAGDRDQVLIYYAGHGYLDPTTSRGYWLPVDAQKDNLANWLSTSDVTDTLAGLAARHAIVIADSCFSGSLLRNPPGIVLDERSRLLSRLAQRRSRTIMTSGGLEPVIDDGGGRHSVFASALLNALHNNGDVLEAGRLFVQVRDRVALEADQTPQYAPIRSAGHDGGDFLFVRRSQNTLPAR